MKNKTPIFAELKWNPKSDISLNELAFCLPYIFNNPYIADFSFIEDNQKSLRHFDKENHYEPIVISENYSIDPRKDKSENRMFEEGTYYNWKPLSDITAFELALAITYIREPHSFYYEESIVDRNFEIEHLPLKRSRIKISEKGTMCFDKPHVILNWAPQSDISLEELLISFTFIKDSIKPTQEIDLQQPVFRHFEIEHHEATKVYKVKDLK